VSFAAVTLCVASQRVFIIVLDCYDSVRKLLDILSYVIRSLTITLHATLLRTVNGTMIV